MSVLGGVQEGKGTDKVEQINNKGMGRRVLLKMKNLKGVLRADSVNPPTIRQVIGQLKIIIFLKKISLFPPKHPSMAYLSHLGNPSQLFR